MTQSTSKPNIQNIPVRTSIGRAIRNAFVQAAVFEADYQEMEEKILAKHPCIERCKTGCLSKTQRVNDPHCIEELRCPSSATTTSVTRS